MAKKPAAGSLKYRVDCQKRTEVDDGYGNTVSRDFETQFTASAAYQHLRGGEGVIAARLENRHPMIVLVRASSDTRQITSDWRLVDTRDGSAFAIRDVTHETDRAWISLLVEKGVAA
ncbi:head-tail adaptor protein [Allomesorhizobium alhagi]|uniref:Phage head-tail adaptor n=1 Tax=Mesorhizobium alhagi CCNWXJ12-2 TaxID=1107882 RepID=H0HR42_9HYPH|nr:head-tail adaptor protein [Mesorhizobium alhagi]EHK56822.1 phage head-tail adaptor [Mesorhizobium alhagi CCNWXJ12-2]